MQETARYQESSIRKVLKIAALAIKSRLPSMCEERQYVESGCVMSYAASDSDRWRRAAAYIDEILKGTGRRSPRRAANEIRVHHQL